MAVMSNVAAAPTAREPTGGQLTVWPVAVHADGDETNVTCVGSVSLACTPSAVDGPLLVTTRRYVKVPPGVTDASTTLFSISTSELAAVMTGVAGLLVLFAGTGSVVGELTVAVFGM